MAESLAALIYIFQIAIYLYVAYTDFMRWKVTNRAVLALLGSAVLAQVNAGFDALLPDLLIAALLFGLTFPFWLARHMGAGDVKLLTVTGFVVGMDEAFPLAALMLAISIVMLVAMSYGRYLFILPAAFNRRFTEILQHGKVPYGVPISLATISLLSLRLVAFL